MAKNKFCETQTLVCSMPELPSRLQSRIVLAGLTVNKGKRPPAAPWAIYAWQLHGRQLGVRQSSAYNTGPLTVFKVLCTRASFWFGDTFLTHGKVTQLQALFQSTQWGNTRLSKQEISFGRRAGRGTFSSSLTIVSFFKRFSSSNQRYVSFCGDPVPAETYCLRYFNKCHQFSYQLLLDESMRGRNYTEQFTQEILDALSNHSHKPYSTSTKPP